jgi:hypothetical protein
MLSCLDTFSSDKYNGFLWKERERRNGFLPRKARHGGWKMEMTLLEVIHYSIVLFFHRMSFHRKSGLLAMHVIPEASALVAMISLVLHKVIVETKEEWED